MIFLKKKKERKKVVSIGPLAGIACVSRERVRPTTNNQQQQQQQQKKKKKKKKKKNSESPNLCAASLDPARALIRGERSTVSELVALDLTFRPSFIICEPGDGTTSSLVLRWKKPLHENVF
jgi:hypothetical protein